MDIFFNRLLVKRVNSMKQIIELTCQENPIAKGQAIELLHEKIDEILIKIEAELSPEELTAHQLSFSDQTEVKDEIYAKALARAKKPFGRNDVTDYSNENSASP